ncbi:L-threonine O-3-phosphate decarboxylase [Litoreibacter ponti]|uniref:Aminotransferase n=1 Tax=Litoreibacter ponti TaxID=1510457 RepID=A0A2T6BN91_9RHOB|nr:threonine-phosphate decarboxylase [Litoreibacter ponti]PTX57512.1 L-threonine O-3-phosphate decarboxylase [Litoreibacter ponti]
MTKRDHGGGLDAAIAEFGGTRASWIDLSTGINPTPYTVGVISAEAWTALPDAAATMRLERAARAFWAVPDGAEVVIAPGASALIAMIPRLLEDDSCVYIPSPTYNEHAAAFEAEGHGVLTRPDGDLPAQVFVHPNNPTGALKDADTVTSRRLNIIDESFCDVVPEVSHTELADHQGVIILKSFGKFWGLAGLRLGFAICPPSIALRLREMLGPWPVSGPALEIGARALEDREWSDATRARLAVDAARLDALVGAPLVGGTALFRLYEVPDARAFQARLARANIWSRIFPYSKTWVRLGLPGPDGWDRLEAAL